MTSRNAAASRTVRVRGPDVASPVTSPYRGALRVRPRVGLTPTSPQALAGMRIDPAPSDPWAIGTSSAATAAADPPEEPPALCWRSYGVRAGGAMSGSV